MIELELSSDSSFIFKMDILKIFKKKENLSEKALEEVVKKNFCGSDRVVACEYHNKKWCPETCGMYVRARASCKYWNR